MVKAKNTGYKCSSCNHGIEPRVDKDFDGNAINIYTCTNYHCELNGKEQTESEEPNQ